MEPRQSISKVHPQPLHCAAAFQIALRQLDFMYAFLVCLPLNFLILSLPCHPSEFSTAIQEMFSSGRNYASLFSHGSL